MQVFSSPKDTAGKPQPKARGGADAQMLTEKGSGEYYNISLVEHFARSAEDALDIFYMNPKFVPLRSLV